MICSSRDAGHQNREERKQYAHVKPDCVVLGRRRHEKHRSQNKAERSPWQPPFHTWTRSESGA